MTNRLEPEPKSPCTVCGLPFLFGSWYHCEKCGQHGYASMYGDGCTACSNARRVQNGEIKLPGEIRNPPPKRGFMDWLRTKLR